MGEPDANIAKYERTAYAGLDTLWRMYNLHYVAAHLGVA